jgi:hypothetical protein
MSRLQVFQHRHAGQRCVLVANGPSLNRMSLDFLKSETVIGLNKIFLGLRKFCFYPRYFVAVNGKVIDQSVNEINALKCVKFIGSQGAAGRVKEDALTYILNTVNPPHRFCHDIVEGVHEGWTVTYAALQIAYYLGFSEVILIGLDHRYSFVGEPNQAMTLDGPDTNHFSDAYFGHGQRWDNPDLSHSEESFRIARAEFERDGRRIIDATLDGACDIFEKSDYRKLFRVENTD